MPIHRLRILNPFPRGVLIVSYRGKGIDPDTDEAIRLVAWAAGYLLRCGGTGYDLREGRRDIVIEGPRPTLEHAARLLESAVHSSPRLRWTTSITED